jgi:hypothetical protein
MRLLFNLFTVKSSLGLELLLLSRILSSLPSSQNWGGQRKIADAGLDRIVPNANGTFERETVCIIECGHAQSLNYLHGRRLAVFANMDVQVYIFIKIFNSIQGNVHHPAHVGLRLRRLVCVQYNRGLDGGIPSYPNHVCSFGTAPLRTCEINVIRAWGFQGIIHGNVPGGVGPPVARNQMPFMVTIAPNLLWVSPPLRPLGLQHLEFDLFEVLQQFRYLS